MATANIKLDIVLKHLNEVYNEGSKSNQYDAIWKTGGEILMACCGAQNDLFDTVVTFYLSNEFPYEMILILDYLSDTEKLIQKKYDNDLRTDKFSILWKGKVFIENGGYVVNAKLMSDENQREISRDLWLVRGSWFAGIMAACWLLFDIYKFLTAHHLVFVCH